MSLAPADLFLSSDLTEEEARQYLRTFGFRDPAAADAHLQSMAEEVPVRQALATTAAALLEAFQRSPDPDAALVGFSRFFATRASKTAFLQYLSDDPRGLRLLAELFGSSPFLGEILIRNPEYLPWLAACVEARVPDDGEMAEQARALVDAAEGQGGDIEALKRFRRRELLRIATRDLLGFETLESATAQLSDLADLVAEVALHIATRRVSAAAGLAHLPGRFSVIAMGKLGGRELNYSSDVDLLYVYEPHQEEDPSAHELFQKLARALTKLLTEHTDESYLYRVDLRLRPMGRQGAMACSLSQCRQYYDTWGETFERFALVKARPMAGDPDLGRRFVELVQPFVYRRYLDHAAIEEMARYQRRRRGTRRSTDRDVKMGHGGIREIELFTQVLQLMYGARDPALRHPNTLEGLAALAGAGLIDEEVRRDLSRAYVLLRTVEHRLQMVEQMQTHSLSTTRAELDICARRSGFETAAALESALAAARERVHAIGRALFDAGADETDTRTRMFFRVLAQDVSDEQAADFLARQGLGDPAAALDAIRSLDAATELAPWRASARNVLANLLSALTDRLARCGSPDRVLIRLEQMVERTGAAVSFFRMLLENEALRDLLVSTFDLGSLSAERLIRYPELLDSLLFRLPPLDALGMRYRAALADLDTADCDDHLRRFKAAEELKILVEWANDRSLDALQERLSLLADCIVAQAASWQAPNEAGGSEPDWVVMGLGKLGGCELSVHSDLDLVVLYRGDPADAGRFGVHQRFVEAIERTLARPTGEGVAYRVDTRLRPEGSKGALAIPFEVFERYLRSRAELWERLAWTRCRWIAGSATLAADVSRAVTSFVYGPWDPRIPHYMTGIRLRQERELAETGGPHLEFKIGRGGLVDIDFLVQMVQIREGQARDEFRVTGTRRLLAALPVTVFLEPEEGVELRAAHGWFRALETLVRIDADTNLSAVRADRAALRPLGRRLGLPEPAGDALIEAFARRSARVRAIYEAVTARLARP